MNESELKELSLNLENLISYLKDNKTVEKNPLNLVVLHQELCRKIICWPLFYILNYEISDAFLEHLLLIGEGFLRLAGGALVSHFYNQEAADYDLFICCSDILKAVALIEKIRTYNFGRAVSFIESSNCLTLQLKDKNSNIVSYQIIKRIYEREDLIIGGFDLDICKLILIGNKIYGTATALACLQQNTIVVNLNSVSKSYKFRIAKYCKKYKTKVYHPHLDSSKIDDYYCFSMNYNKESFSDYQYKQIVLLL